jgi:quercetin dioxygenase-like cupin family protein
MRNFVQLASNLDVRPLLIQLALQPQLWNAHQLRTRALPKSPHKEIDDILLRFQPPITENYTGSAVDGIKKLFDYYMNTCECESYPASWALPQAWPLIGWLMLSVRGVRLGRVMITRMPPGTEIAEHRDEGEYALWYERYHICLTGTCDFFADGDHVQMKPGEAWWFNGQSTHHLINNTQSDRIHLLVDIHVEKYK